MSKQSSIDRFFILKTVSSKSVVAPNIEEVIDAVFKGKRAHVQQYRAGKKFSVTWYNRDKQ